MHANIPLHVDHEVIAEVTPRPPGSATTTARYRITWSRIRWNPAARQYRHQRDHQMNNGSYHESASGAARIGHLPQDRQQVARHRPPAPGPPQWTTTSTPDRLTTDGRSGIFDLANRYILRREIIPMVNTPRRSRMPARPAIIENHGDHISDLDLAMRPRPVGRQNRRCAATPTVVFCPGDVTETTGAEC